MDRDKCRTTDHPFFIATAKPAATASAERQVAGAFNIVLQETGQRRAARPRDDDLGFEQLEVRVPRDI